MKAEQPAAGYRFAGQFTTVEEIGPVPAGVRANYHFTGTITEGPLAGSSVRGIDYALVRADGVTVLDVRAVVTTPAGERLDYRAGGYGVPQAAVSAPVGPTGAEPGVPPPTGRQALHGYAFIQSGASTWDWLNQTTFAWEGTIDLATGALETTGRVPPHGSPG